MKRLRETNKRSISKSEKHHNYSDKISTLTSTERKNIKKSTSPSTLQKPTFEQIQFPQSLNPIQNQYQQLTQIINIISNSIGKIKPFILLKSAEARQIYNHLKTYRLLLSQQIKKFRNSLISFVSSLSSEEKTMTQKLQFVEKSPKKRCSSYNYQYVAQNHMTIKNLKDELQDLNQITQNTLNRERNLQNQLLFQRVEISKYKELLKCQFETEPINVYFDLICKYKDVKMHNNSDSIQLQKKIQNQQQYLKHILNKSKFQKVQSAQRISQKESQLIALIESFKSDFNNTNQGCSKVKQNIRNAKVQLISLTRILNIQHSDNFFEEIISIKQKIQEINNKLAISESPLPQKIQNILKTLSILQTENCGQKIKIKEQEELLEQATEEYENVTASYVQINNKHIDLIKNYANATQKVQLLQNQNNELTKLIKKINQTHEDESSQQVQVILVDEQTIVKELRQSQQYMRKSINILKEQCRIGQGLRYKSQQKLRIKNMQLSDLNQQVTVYCSKMAEKESQLAHLLEIIKFQKSEIAKMESKICIIQRNTTSSNFWLDEKNELLEHISKQQIELNKFSKNCISNKQTISSLESQIALLAGQIVQLKNCIHLQKSELEAVQQKCQNLMKIINVQEFELIELAQHLNKKVRQVQNLEEQIISCKQELMRSKDQTKVKSAELAKTKTLMSDIQFENVKMQRKCERLQYIFQQKDQIIRDNQLEINNLKNNIEDCKNNSTNNLKKTLFQDLELMIQQQKFQSRNFLKVPVPEFIEMKEDTQMIPLAYSQNISISVLQKNEQVFNGHNEFNILQELQQEKSLSNNFDRFLQNFSSNNRIQQIDKMVVVEIQQKQQPPKRPFSSKRISEIVIQNIHRIVNNSDDDLLGLI